jgi:hypothetical protein
MSGGTHTVEWTDGLTVTRILTVQAQIMLLLRWQGRETYVRLGPRLAEITDSKRAKAAR